MSVTLNPNVMGRNGKTLNNSINSLYGKDKPKPEEKSKPKPLSQGLAFKGIEQPGRENPRSQVIQENNVLVAIPVLNQGKQVLLVNPQTKPQKLEEKVILINPEEDGEDLILETPFVTGAGRTAKNAEELLTAAKNCIDSNIASKARNITLNSDGTLPSGAKTALETLVNESTKLDYMNKTSLQSKLSSAGLQMQSPVIEVDTDTLGELANQAGEVISDNAGELINAGIAIGTTAGAAIGGAVVAAAPVVLPFVAIGAGYYGLYRLLKATNDGSDYVPPAGI